MKPQALIRNSPAKAFSGEMDDALKDLERELLDFCRASGELASGLERIITSGGKRLRPLLAWTCWHMTGGKREIVPLMAMLELMHTASLIHDDLVDGAETRRGSQTINAASGPIQALRSGDYLLSRAMTFLKIYRGTGINEALSDVSQEMCLGELDQRAGLFVFAGLTEEAVLDRMRRKTALLMAESCRSGAVAGGGGAETAAACREYGLHLGLAFQLRDDLLDFSPESRTGKPPLQDLRSGVATLPLLYAARERPETVFLMEKREKTQKELESACAVVKETHAMEKAKEKLLLESQRAVDALSPLPDSAEKQSLCLMAKTLSEVKNLV